jgi:hypothetical protein
MGISLTGLTPATTYDALIKVGDNGPIDATLKVLSDGLGTNLPMEASTTGVNFTGTLQQSGVAVPTAGQVAAKQDTLVSGTNIKTINSTSILGSGNISVVTSPSGVAGAIQFSNGSAFASDAANLFWDDTNNRLGVGTNVPSVKYDQQGGGALFNMGGGGTNSFRVQRSGITLINAGTDNAGIYLTADGGNLGAIKFVKTNGTQLMQINDISTVATINGIGATSATTSLLVQNSAGTAALTVKDDLVVTFGNYIAFANNDLIVPSNSSGALELRPIVGKVLLKGATAINTTGAMPVASAMLDIVSTTSGFLPPRMTTTQKNAIASPATGLVLYDSTTNKLQCYDGSTWNDLF